MNLRLILLNAIKKSNLPVKTYASRHGIHLGVESSLRSIRNREASCVLISLNLRPGHLISLISQNVYTKSPRVITFAQPNLEKFTREVFGVNAVVVSLPKETDRMVCEPLQDWIKDKREKYLPRVELIANVLESNTRNNGGQKTQLETATDLKEQSGKTKPLTVEKTQSSLDKTCNKDKGHFNLVTVKMPVGSNVMCSENTGKAQQVNVRKKLSGNKQELSDALTEIVQQAQTRSNEAIIKENSSICGPVIVFRIKPNPARMEKAAKKQSLKNSINGAVETNKTSSKL